MCLRSKLIICDPHMFLSQLDLISIIVQEISESIIIQKLKRVVTKSSILERCEQLKLQHFIVQTILFGRSKLPINKTYNNGIFIEIIMNILNSSK